MQSNSTVAFLVMLVVEGSRFIIVMKPTAYVLIVMATVRFEQMKFDLKVRRDRQSVGRER